MIKMQIEGHGFYEVSCEALDRTMYELQGVSIGRLRGMLYEHTGLSYASMTSMSELLIIATDTQLAI